MRMLGLLLVVAIGGCGLSPSGDQQARVKIIDAFEADPVAATERYRSEWQAMGPDRSCVVAIAIAGELMAHDPVRYDEYEPM